MQGVARFLGITALLALAVAAIASTVLKHRPYRVPKNWAPPSAAPDSGLRLRYLGVSGYVVDDGDTVLVLDPAISRPSLRGLLSGPIDSDPEFVTAMTPRADYVIVNHSHYDHILDAATIARHAGATVVGSRSTANLMRARGIPEKKIQEIAAPATLQLGSFSVEVFATEHPPLLGIDQPMLGTIPGNAGPLWFWQYRLDTTMYFRIASPRGSVWFIPAGLANPRAFAGKPADTLILGIAGNPIDSVALRHILAVAQPKRVLPTHYDNFFQPVKRGLSLLPTVDLERVYTELQSLAPGTAWHVLQFGDNVGI